ncbi:MAG: pimeloyl-ACP methyl ester carboxylesterase [Pseudohongiellaceae bacterium]
MSASGQRPGRTWSWLRWCLLSAVVGGLCLVFVLAGQLSVPDRRLPGSTPGDLDVEFTAVTLQTRDGLSLAAWAVEPVGPVLGAVLLFHGKDGCRSPGRLAAVAKAGLAGLSLDHRGHGGSDGERTGFGWFERFDVEAAVKEARERWGDVPLIGWGTSQGAAALVYAVDPRDGVLAANTFSGLLLESLYVEIETAFDQRIELSLGGWAVPFAGAVMTLAAWRGDLSGLELSPRGALQRAVAGGLSAEHVLLASGGEDHHATPLELQQLAEVVPGCVVELLPGLGHVDLWSRGTASWRETVLAFFRRVTGSDSGPSDPPR